MDDLYRNIYIIATTSGILIPQALADEIHYRCNDLEVDNIENNIKACLIYAIDNGCEALINEDDDGNIWEYC